MFEDSLQRVSLDRRVQLPGWQGHFVLHTGDDKKTLLGARWREGRRGVFGRDGCDA